MIVGIDPGFTGAIAILDKKGEIILYDMPTLYIMKRKQVDGKALTRFFKPISHIIEMAIVEDVHAMPEQGVTSTFRFGYSAGIIMGVLQALGIKTLRVKPSAWKQALGLSRDKAESLSLATKLFPKYKSYFKRAKDDGRAEACLIAHFGMNTF